ncbi:hypothetical protein ACFV6F_12165 [Kitasatospora phosalacinea]|uniref:hypothetical protein n=1 Tax=Kitasatospora phosalacinea TaxID=2065 RepID=UPI00364696BE
MNAENVENGEPVRPGDVVAMLADRTGACAMAREAVAAGGEVSALGDPVPHWMVHGIAARRLRSTRRTGQPTVGLDESVAVLRQHPGEMVRTGTIRTVDRSWHFQLYFDATGTALLACSAVGRVPPARGGR